MIAVAVLLSSASPGGRVVPSAQARVNPCVLQIDKQEVDEGDLVVRAEALDGDLDDDIFYEITVRNVAQEEAEDEIRGCDGFTVQDFLERTYSVRTRSW